MPRASIVLALTAALSATPAAAVQRAFVASFGSDANAAASCGFAAPCRSFSMAVSVVDSGGEVLALDSIGYGVVTIDKSVTLTAAPGAYAGISVSAAGTGTGVTIATPGINVTLRGLTINNIGGSFGVTMTNGSRLSIENCVLSNFSQSGGYAVFVDTPANVRIVDSLIRDNDNGVVLQGGAIAEIANTKVFGNWNNGILVLALTAATTTVAAITDTVVSGGSGFGIASMSTQLSGTTRVSVMRSMIANNVTGMLSQSTSGGVVQLAIGDNMVTANGTGLHQSGFNATIESLGTNLVLQNGNPSMGTITPVAGM